jgi:hypothetical protein
MKLPQMGKVKVHVYDILESPKTHCLVNEEFSCIMFYETMTFVMANKSLNDRTKKPTACKGTVSMSAKTG